MTLYLIHWYPYANRQILRKETVEEYLSYSQTFLGTSSYQTISDFNFNPNDGVDTSIVVNATDYGEELWDYVLVVDSEEIKSRWFILEATRTRRGQYKLTLRRDSVADLYNLAFSSEFFVEKGKLPSDSPLLYQSEGQVLNQIKKEETLLPDSTGCAWLVGYISKDTPANYLKGTINTGTSPADITLSSSIESWDLYQYTTTPAKIATDIQLSFHASQYDSYYNAFLVSGFIIHNTAFNALTGEQTSYRKSVSQWVVNTGRPTALYLPGDYYYHPYNKTKPTYDSESIIKAGGAIKTGRGYVDDDTASLILSLVNGKTVKDGDGNYYFVKAVAGSSGTASNWINYSGDGESEAWAYMLEACEKGGTEWDELPSADTIDGSFKDSITYRSYYIVISALSDQASTYDLSSFTNVETYDSAYQVVCIPYPLSGTMTLSVGSNDGSEVTRSATSSTSLKPSDYITTETITVNQTLTEGVKLTGLPTGTYEGREWQSVKVEIPQNIQGCDPKIESIDFKFDDYLTSATFSGYYIEGYYAFITVDDVTAVNFSGSKFVNITWSYSVTMNTRSYPSTIYKWFYNLTPPVEGATLASVSLGGNYYGMGVQIISKNKNSDGSYSIYLYFTNCETAAASGAQIIIQLNWTYTTNINDIFGATTISQQDSLRFAQGIIKQLASYSYDWQLLPYCPCPQFIQRLGDGIFVNLDTISEDTPSDLEAFQNCGIGTNAEGSLANVCLLAPYSNLSFSITNLVTIPTTDDADEAENIKISSDCDVYRLVSPNYNGDFEFSVAKNGGVTYWEVDCSFKPYQPYVHVAPRFSNLYGSDFNDARGLTCGGDFSIDQTSDKWQEYQINNKNYQTIFDRQIQHMDFNRGLDRISDVAGIIGGSASAGRSMGLTAAIAGVGATGIAGGAIAGAALSAAGGIADYAINEAQYKENRQYTIDNFNLQLGNIQALPYSLTKVSSYNPNSKLVPFLEYFGPTDEERTAYLSKIRRDGMSIGIIDNLYHYVSGEADQYVRAQLIRANTYGFSGGNHEIKAMADEIAKGVYL